MKDIIIFTVSYPYGTKEQFLETEIKYLSQHFKKVIVIPAYISKEARGVPANVSVDTVFAEKNSNLHFFMSSLFSKYLYKELAKHPFVLLSLARLSKLFSFIGKGRSLYKHLKNYYDHEYIFYSYWFNGSVFGCYLYDKYAHEISFYTRVHGSDLYLEVNKNYLPLRPLILSKIKKVFTISEHGKEYLQRHYQVNENKLKVSRLGTQEQNISTLMSREPSEFCIVSCSHISPVKRIDMLIKALSIVAKNNLEINIKWVHIGSGKEQKVLEGLAFSMSSENLKMNFLGGMSNKDIFEYYKTHDIDLFVNVSRSEGLPVTFMEAFNCGIPVFAIDNGGISEIVNNDNGILLKHDSSLEQIASGLSDCIRNKDELFSKKCVARTTWEKSYNADSNYIKFCKELNEND